MSSATTTPYYQAPLAAHHHFNLRMILRSANERYHSIAEGFRQNLHLSHHAQKRAQAKGLKIDTAQAARCPQKFVSVLPLCVIDPTVSPTLNRAASEDLEPVIPLSVPVPVFARRPALPRLSIPLHTYAHREALVIPSDVSVSKAARGSWNIYAPAAIRGQGNPWRGPTSRFSITPDNELFQIHLCDSPEPVIPDLPRHLIEDSGSEGGSSSGPSTPDEFSSPVVRLKRKPLDVEDQPTSAEKRAKYVRKEWANSQRQRQNAPERPLYNRHMHSGISHLLA
jgi:hypothetical protein